MDVAHLKGHILGDLSLDADGKGLGVWRLDMRIKDKSLTSGRHCVRAGNDRIGRRSRERWRAKATRVTQQNWQGALVRFQVAVPGVACGRENNAGIVVKVEERI